MVVNVTMDEPFTEAEDLMSRSPLVPEPETGPNRCGFRSTAMKNEWKPEILSAVIGALQREFPGLPTFEIVQLVWNIAHVEPETLGAIGLLRKARISAFLRVRDALQENVRDEGGGS